MAGLCALLGGCVGAPPGGQAGAQSGAQSEARTGAASEARANTPTEASLVFRTSDGFTVAADLHVPPAASPAAPAPLVVLGHELDRSRRAWDPLVPALVEAGYAVVAVDHRGFGGSRREAGSAAELTDAAKAGFRFDLLGAVDAAGADARVDTSRVAAVGSGISASAAVACASARPSVRVVLLFVGLLDPEAHDYLLEHPDLPLLMVASSGDARGMALMRQYASRFSGPDQSYVEVMPSGEEVADWRGSDGLASDSGLAELVRWFLERHLPPR